METLRLDDKGNLDLSSVNTLSRDELQSWIEARLHGGDSVVPGGARYGVGPYALLGSIYDRVERDTRAYMRSIVAEALYDMARNENSIWRGEAAEYLLLLAQKLGEEEFVAPVEEMVREERFAHGDDANEEVHVRLLQTLYALRWTGGDVAFWTSQIRNESPERSLIAFSALQRIGLKEAITILPEMPWTDEAMYPRLRLALRNLLRAHRTERVVELLTSVWGHLPEEAQRCVREVLPEMGTKMVLECADDANEWVQLKPAQRLDLSEKRKPETSLSVEVAPDRSGIIVYSSLLRKGPGGLVEPVRVVGTPRHEPGISHRDLLDTLTEREAAVFGMRYGIGRDCSYSVEEVSERLNMGPVLVRVTVRRARKRLLRHFSGTR